MIWLTWSKAQFTNESECESCLLKASVYWLVLNYTTCTCVWTSCQELLSDTGMTAQSQLIPHHTECSVQTRKMQLSSQCWVHGWHLLLATHGSIAWWCFLVVSHLESGSCHHLLHVNDVSWRRRFFQFLTQRLNKPWAACLSPPAVSAWITDTTLAPCSHGRPPHTGTWQTHHILAPCCHDRPITH